MKRALLLAAAALMGACASPSDPTAPPKRYPPIVVPAAPTPNPGPSMLPPAKPGPAGTPAPPDGSCPPEGKRGWAFYRADWAGGSCVGHDECAPINKAFGFPTGVRIAFDSTPLKTKAGDPMPAGCPVPPTRWSIDPHVPMNTKPNEPFAMQATFAAWGNYAVTSAGSPGAEAKRDVVRIR